MLHLSSVFVQETLSEFCVSALFPTFCASAGCSLAFPGHSRDLLLDPVVLRRRRFLNGVVSACFDGHR